MPLWGGEEHLEGGEEMQQDRSQLSGVKLGRVWTTISGKWILRVFCVLGRVAEVNLEHLNSGFPRSFWVI